MPASDTLSALTQAADGLSYTSESDAPWSAFAWPAAVGDPTPNGVRKQGRHNARVPIREQPVEEFFAPLVKDQDWYGDEEKATAAKYRALWDMVKQRLTNPKVVRVGKVNVTVYVVGVVAEGGWAGVKTKAVET